MTAVLTTTSLRDRLLFLAVFVICGLYGLFGSFEVAATGLVGLIGFWSLVTGRIRAVSTLPSKLATITCLVCVAGGMLSLALHPDDPANLENALMRFSALWFLPLASMFALLERAVLLELMQKGAALGALATMAYVGVELGFIHERAWAGAGNPGPFATIMAVQFAICTTAFLSAGDRYEKYLYLAGMIAAALCVLASGMRTAIPALLLIPVVSFLFVHRPFAPAPSSANSGAPIRTLAALLLVLAVLSVLQADRIHLLWQETLFALSSGAADNSLGHRIAMWGYAASVLPDTWLTGSGLEFALDEMQARTKSLYGFGLGKNHFHNFALTSLLRGGIADLLATTVFLLTPVLMILVAGSRASATGKALLANLFIVYGLMAMFNLAFGHDILDHFFIAMLAIGAVLLQGDQDTIVENTLAAAGPTHE